MLTLLVGSLIAALAAFAQAVTGFGFALVLVPLLALLYDPKLVVMISLSLGILTKLPLLAQCWRQVEPVRIAPLSLAAIVGSGIGTQALLRVDADALRLAIGVVVVVLATPLLFDHRRPAKREGLVALGVGMVSGALNGATSMGGPPVVLLGVNQSWGKESFRANLLAFFLVTNLSSLAFLSAARALSVELLWTDLRLVPAVLVGIAVGNATFRAIPAERFRQLVVLLVIASGLLSIWTGARG